MAKRKMTGVNVAAPIEMPQRMYIDLRDEDVEMVSEVKVGETVYIAIKGKVVGLSKRDASYPEGRSKTGDIQLEDVEVELASKGAFDALAEDD